MFVGVRFVSEFTTPTGEWILSGHWHSTNKRDFDVAVTFYQQTADNNTCIDAIFTRASYAHNQSAVPCCILDGTR
jgi:hypothetical protein